MYNINTALILSNILPIFFFYRFLKRSLILNFFITIYTGLLIDINIVVFATNALDQHSTYLFSLIYLVLFSSFKHIIANLY